ncbi:MAG: TetR/AcrR family transcriptional regulator [Candidatus Gastranaerophilales bacterium]|nr:TetR/AcrR family transcriptional regulator [Candidatus Gastranaerophilales bacterium]
MEDNSRTKILLSATKLFALKGFDGVSIREICREADVNISMISYYFGGKNELYQAIVDEQSEKINKYTKTFMDINQDISKLSKKEQISLLNLLLDKLIDYFYSDISNDFLSFMLKEQHNPHAKIKGTPVHFIRKLVGAIFDKDYNDREIIFKTNFIISMVNSPRILPSFTLKLLGQDDFIQEDIKIIKDNLKLYINTLLKEAGID